MRRFLVFATLAGLVFIGAQAFLEQPVRAASRRPLAPAEAQRLQSFAADSDTAQWLVSALDAVGVSSRLDQSQLDQFRALGTDEVFLLRYLAEYGITPEESQALESVGVEMALSDPTAMDVFQWAALADEVVVGEVAEVRGNPDGPYHTYVDLDVFDHLKDAGGERPDRVTGTLLRSGPRAHAVGGDVHVVDAMDEPDLKPGERVVLFLSRVPLNLISHLASTLANSGGELPAGFAEEYGSLQEQLALLDAPQDSEVVLAYKVVQDKAVLKVRAYRVAGPYDVIDLDQLTARIDRIAAVQEAVRAAADAR